MHSQTNKKTEKLKIRERHDNRYFRDRSLKVIIRKYMPTEFYNIEETILLTIDHEETKHSNRPQDH